MSDIFGKLRDLPRVPLGHTPTPLETMDSLVRCHPDRQLLVKRDDCTGLAFGGNKVRQLEFYLGEAQAQGADTILITGAVQSNFVRLAAAAARKLGMECHIQLEQRVTKSDPLYQNSGNVLLDKLLGATLHSYSQGEDEAGADRRLRDIADELASKGRRPYVIPLAPGHKPLGALGYVIAAEEILAQCNDRGLVLDEVIVPSGSGNTHAGLLFGFRALGCAVRVTGVCVRRAAALQQSRIAARCQEIASLLNVGTIVEEVDIHLIDDALAPGYGQLNPATLAAIDQAARQEALILDPVYSGKAMVGFLDRVTTAAEGQSLLFIHTGGTPAVFAYGDILTSALPSPSR